MNELDEHYERLMEEAAEIRQYEEEYYKAYARQLEEEYCYYLRGQLFDFCRPKYLKRYTRKKRQK